VGVIDFIPKGAYKAVLKLGDTEVFTGELNAEAGEVSITAQAGSRL